MEWNVIEILSPTVPLSLLGFFDGHFYLRGDSVYLTSTNGVDWESHPHAVPSEITNGKGLWVAYQDGGLLYGTNLEALIAVPGLSPTVSDLVYGTRPAP